MKYCKLLVMCLMIGMTILSTSLSIYADGYFPEKESKPLTPDGNVLLEDDISTTTASDKQFITVVTKNGHYFYIIIDRDKDGKENVHFLNQVDEADLMTILKEEDTYRECSCTVRCITGKVDTTCPVCILDQTSCNGKEEVVIPETEIEEEEPNGNKTGLFLFLVVGIGIAGYLGYRKIKQKQATDPVSQPDEFFMYDEDDDDAYTAAFEEFAKENAGNDSENNGSDFEE